MAKLFKRAKSEPEEDSVPIHGEESEEETVLSPGEDYDQEVPVKPKKTPKPKAAKKGKEAAPPKKKARTSAASSGSNGDWKTNEQGEKYVELSAVRRLTVREFKGKPLIDIREFYTDKATGEAKPGSKGIALSPEQWTALKGSMNAVDALLA